MMNNFFSLKGLFLAFTLISLGSKVVYAQSAHLHKEIEFLSINNLNKLKKVEAIITRITTSKKIGKKEQLILIRNIDRRHELLLRHDFLRRLTSHTDNHYKGQEKMPFLIEQLSYMAQNEARSPKPNKQFLKFILSCRQVLIDRPIRQNNPVELIERYMKYTLITQNKTAASFYNESDYSNRSESYTARDVSYENLGDKLNLETSSFVTKEPQQVDLDLLPHKSDQELVSQQLYLQERIKSSSVTKSELTEPLKNTKKLNIKDVKKYMNQSDFNKLFGP